MSPSKWCSTSINAAILFWNVTVEFYWAHSFFVAEVSFVVGSCSTVRICDVTRTCWVNRERETNLDPSLRMDTRSHVRGAQTVSNSFFYFHFHYFFFIIIIISPLASVSAEKIKLLTDRSATLFLFCRWSHLETKRPSFYLFFIYSDFFFFFLFRRNFSGGFSLL